MTEFIEQIIEAVKALPVDCSSFDAADAWVGLVLALGRLRAELAAHDDESTEEENHGG